MSPGVPGRQAAVDIQEGTQGVLIPIIREDPFLAQKTAAIYILLKPLMSIVKGK